MYSDLLSFMFIVTVCVPVFLGRHVARRIFPFSFPLLSYDLHLVMFAAIRRIGKHR